MARESGPSAFFRAAEEDTMRAFVTAVVAVAAVGCVGAKPTAITDPAEAQCVARITVPSSATGLLCVREDGLDSFFHGRFDIPAADLPSLLDRMPADRKVEPHIKYSYVAAHQSAEPWWQPGQLRAPRVAEWAEPGFAVHLLFGESDSPGVLTVYFCNFSM
jgi:hypothetical protein